MRDKILDDAVYPKTLIHHPSPQTYPCLTASKTGYKCVINVLGNWCTILSPHELFISGCCFFNLYLPRLKRSKERFITLLAVKWEYIKVRFEDRFRDKCHIYNALGEMMAADNLPSWCVPNADFDSGLFRDRCEETVCQQSMGDCEWIMEVKFYRDRRMYCLGSEQSRQDAFSDSTEKSKEREQTFIKSFVRSFVNVVSQMWTSC